MVTLITGADGYLGRRLVGRLLDSTDDEIVAWMRARDEDDFRRKRGSMEAAFSSRAGRLRYACGDLASADPFGTVSTEGIRRIFHTAAVTAFNVPRESAEAINVRGSERLFDFARRCGQLDVLGHLSTVYASGLRDGTIREESFEADAGFANHYEWSKWAAERALVERYDDVPWQVYRIATVLCDDASGNVQQFNIVHKVWRLLYWGLLPLVPGNPATPLYLVTGDFVTDAMWRLSATTRFHTFYHVTHDRAAALSLTDWVDRAYDVFRHDAQFKARRILKPLFADEQSFQQMAENAGMFAKDTLGHVIKLVRPFAKQMFIAKNIKNDALVAGLGADPSVDLPSLVDRTCARLIATQWGLGPEAPRETDGGA